MKKGFLLWTFIILLVLGFVVWWLVTVVFGGIDESVRTSARLESERIAGIVNTLMISPKGSEQIIVVKGDCKVISITEGGVLFARNEKNSYFTSFIAGVRISPFSTTCAEKETMLTFKRDADRIVIT